MDAEMGRLERLAYDAPYLEREMARIIDGLNARVAKLERTVETMAVRARHTSKPLVSDAPARAERPLGLPPELGEAPFDLETELNRVQWCSRPEDAAAAGERICAHVARLERELADARRRIDGLLDYRDYAARLEAELAEARNQPVHDENTGRDG